ncbi:BQ5605_C025g10064 [Microbotryum silenes-dioicae]|uniref:BQ5605_C025g10064 protein n=1 Tax=Microbotryum silenes-dioicae TaxID=796604 RepID=A0A2X0MR46_9BASI|nr:BQ5605_C025g10064 [Microbotryum silenes-dioicae]
MQGLSQGIIPVELDVNSPSRPASPRSFGKRARLLPTDVCINNAGQGCVAPLIEVDPAELRKTFDVNVFGLLTMVQAGAPHVVEQRSGTIVNIGSIVAYVPTPWAGVYCATKAAVHSLSDTLRMELRGFGIKVVCVAPGAIKSAIGASNDKRAVLSLASVYSNVESFVRLRGSWSQRSKLIPKVAQAKQELHDSDLSMTRKLLTRVTLRVGNTPRSRALLGADEVSVVALRSDVNASNTAL